MEVLILILSVCDFIGRETHPLEDGWIYALTLYFNHYKGSTRNGGWRNIILQSTISYRSSRASS